MDNFLKRVMYLKKNTKDPKLCKTIVMFYEYLANSTSRHDHVKIVPDIYFLKPKDSNVRFIMNPTITEFYSYMSYYKDLECFKLSSSKFIKSTKDEYSYGFLRYKVSNTCPFDVIEHAIFNTAKIKYIAFIQWFYIMFSVYKETLSSIIRSKRNLG